MRKDGLIYNDLDEFAFIGYSIRENDFPFLEGQHKPGCKVITYDRLLGPVHPIMDKLSNPSRSAFKNNETGLLEYERIIEYYSELTKEEQIKLSIYGYAIEHASIFKYTHPPRGWSRIGEASTYKFIYSIYEITEPRGEFRGFDVVEVISDFSAVSNCSINWKVIEDYGYLNEYHLFDNYQDAKKFNKYVDELIEDRAPFCVFGIWELKK